MKFIKDYIFLLETRFKDKFRVDINIANEEFWIPPVTLQQLVENAIKHNQTSYSKPLEIRIKQEEDFLVVENEKNANRTPVVSTGIGLLNITQRFEHLTDRKVDFSDLNDTFTVRIPLISNYESSYRWGWAY